MQNQTIIRKLYGASTATTSDLAHIDMPYAARVVGIGITIMPTAAADGDYVAAELSVASSAQHTTNDSQGVLAYAASSFKLATNGGSQNSVNAWRSGFAIFLPAGTRIYLHTMQVGTSNTRVFVDLHLLPA